MSEMKSDTKTKTANTLAAEDVSALLRARNPLIWIVTREEARVERYLIEAAGAAGYIPRMWDVSQGATEASGVVFSRAQYAQEPGTMLTYIDAQARLNAGGERCVWIMRDLPVWLAPPVGMTLLRQMRNLVRFLPSVMRERAQAMIVLSTSGEVPPELAAHATVIEWPLPDRSEVAAILDAAINALPESMQATAAPNGTREAAIDATIGLTGEEAAACYAKSLVQHRRVDPGAVSKEKKRVIARERVLEWFDPLPGGLDAVGGLANLKDWLKQRKLAYSPKARAYGLPAPKGALLVGIPGCGKSLTAKAIATAWGVPLLRMDLGALKSKFVGESEANLRKAFKVIESVGRCVVWFDEIEKALAGATQGAADGGVSSDALGSVLSWMQDRQGEAFVIATANDVSGLPPELLRKGRFDEVWFVEMPTSNERVEVLKAALAAHGRAGAEVDFRSIAGACNEFTGSEIAALVPDAMFAAFADGEREVTTEDLLAAAKSVVPLSKTMAERLDRLRTWAKGRARMAGIPEDAQAQGSSRQLDI